MHTVVVLAHAVNLLERLGYQVRQEWLEGHGGGPCELRGRRILFLDISLSPREQMDQVLALLRREPGAGELSMPAELRALLPLKKIA